MIRPASQLLFGYPLLAALLLSGSERPKSLASLLDSTGPRVLEQETRASVIRDYLQAWQSLGQALSGNRLAGVDDYFVGVAKSRLEGAVREQRQLRIHVIYRNQTHDPRIVFYSPDGLSVQIIDDVGYQLEVRDHGRVVASQDVRSPYVAVMTPTENKWKVRILQAAAQ